MTSIMNCWSKKRRRIHDKRSFLCGWAGARAGVVMLKRNPHRLGKGRRGLSNGSSAKNTSLKRYRTDGWMNLS